jgi:hypothetical protein
MPIENQTPNRGYLLPHASNELQQDVARIIAALTGIDLDVAGILTNLLTKSEVGHGHVMTDVTGLIAALTAKQDLTGRGSANGYAALGSDGKVPAEQLPAALFGALSYQGTWNANTNTPTIPAAAVANKGHYYRVSTAGTTTVGGFNDWQIGDWVTSNGTSWDKIDNTDQVMSVAGLMGVITAVALKTALAIAIADVAGLQTALNAKADAARSIGVGGLATGGGDLSANRTITVPKSSNPQAVAGVDDTTAMTPVRTKEAVAVHQGAAKAWVNFNGTGTVAIRDSYNVTSVTDNATGRYTVNFTVAMANANYAAMVSVSRGVSNNDIIANIQWDGAYSTVAVGIGIQNASNPSIGTGADAATVNVAIFGD